MSEPIKSYRDLVAWQKAFLLGVAAHRMCSLLPEAERFGLAAQIRRTAIQIASHIAQGYGKGVTGDYLWYLKSARSGLYELDTQMLFAVEFQYFTQEQYQPVKSLLDESERVLAGLIRSLGG